MITGRMLPRGRCSWQAEVDMVSQQARIVEPSWFTVGPAL